MGTTLDFCYCSIERPIAISVMRDLQILRIGDSHYVTQFTNIASCIKRVRSRAMLELGRTK